MSNYPIWWEDTITLFNRYENKQTGVVTWFKTIFTGCFWKNTGNRVTVGDVVLDTENVICRIPKQANYMNSYDWKQLSNDNMGKYFTLQQGDIIIRGVVSDSIDEYTKGKHATDFIAKYKEVGCIEIKKFNVNIGSGKNNEHYYVNGL